MDQCVKKKLTNLPHTSRVNIKIREYWEKYGQERDLEKFMRLYSPGGSQKSKHSSTTTGSSSCCASTSDDGIAMRRLFSPDACLVNVSASMPNIEMACERAEREIIVPIEIEKTAATDGEAASSSKENVTPRKRQLTKTKETQTPDSITKSHKRLEWDSLGDVGYKKSTSTSSISTFERSLLKEFFQEAVTAAAGRKQANASEGDLEKLQKELCDVRPTKRTSFDHSHGTPPLACSTAIEHKLPHPKQVSQGTSMSFEQRYEKYVQTSMQRPGLTSQEVQVNLSTRTPLLIGSSATPSSFEGYSSRSSHSTATSHECAARKKTHPFIKSISDLLQSHRRTESIEGAGREAGGMERSLESFKETANGMKSNSSSGPSSPQLDLGVQLLCSLIDAKGLSQRKKRQLVRDIAKRISLISITSDLSSEPANSVASSVSRRIQSEAEKENLQSAGENKIKDSLGRQTQAKSSEYSVETAQEEVTTTTTLSSTKTNSESQKTVALTAKAKRKPAESSADSQIKSSHEAVTTRKSAVSSLTPDSHTTTTTTELSTSTSKELITQKAANVASTSSTDAEQPTMREWLNPMTESEILYEERRREFCKNADKRGQLLPKLPKTEVERESQLSWIDTEIKRLESLRLLLKKDIQTISADKATLKPSESTSGDTIYDSVYSEEEATPVSESSAEHLLQSIEVIIEDVSDESSSERKRNEPKEKQNYDTVPQGKTRSRKDKREKDAKDAETKVTQRSKIDTPAGSNDTESVGSFVQQRKREFMEHYNNNKKVQADLLKQQQKRDRQKQRAHEPKSHYSQAHTMPLGCPMHCCNGGFHHMHWPHGPPPPPPHFFVPQPLPKTAGMNVKNSSGSSQPSNPNNRNNSSSLFCLTSDMSVPMGGSSSTPTTTHQYDDVVVGGGVRAGAAGRARTGFSGFGPSYRVPHHTKHSGKTGAVQIKPTAISYVINFDQKKDKGASSSSTTDAEKAKENKQPQTSSSQKENSTTSSTSSASKTQPRLTLRDHLERANPKFVAHVKERKAILRQIQSMRQEREREMREIVDNNSITSLDRKLEEQLPPPPTKQIRIFATKEMKAMTNKRVAKLSEVLQRQELDKEERRRRSNRILRDVFNRRLQKLARSGKLSLNHSKTVI